MESIGLSIGLQGASMIARLMRVGIGLVQTSVRTLGNAKVQELVF